ncbi:hypothetical protein [uncultured Herbaspirillum sp.]|uniref:hypothetical protein n=1 Tax=uncultured Herbaspirillum sp. TaxID=160236 RepID=UPI00258258F5|nr:hypothetical protein [uncultured Herbaspirillum sp.]
MMIRRRYSFSKAAENRPTHLPWGALIISCLLAWHVTAHSQDIPPYLQTARDLVNDVKPEDNSYQHHGWIKLKGESTLFGKVEVSEVHADCSGLIDALLERSAPQVLKVFRSQNWKSYPKAENYYAAISADNGFEFRKRMEDVEPGDIFAAKFDNEMDTGHVMLVDAKPRLIETPIEPIVADTQQWEIVVIDSSSSHGKTDTRFRASGKKQTGIGRGSVRVYTDKAGQLVGWVMTMSPRQKFKSTGSLAIGKPVL